MAVIETKLLEYVFHPWKIYPQDYTFYQLKVDYNGSITINNLFSKIGLQKTELAVLKAVKVTKNTLCFEEKKERLVCLTN